MAEGITTQVQTAQDQVPQQRQSALASIETRTYPGVRIVASQPSAVLSVQGIEGSTIASLGSQHGLLWTGPTRRMVVAENESPQELAMTLADLSGDVMVTDVSHAWCRLTLEGSGVRVLLQSGVGLDLSPTAWPVGHSAPTAFREVQVLLHVTGPDRFDLYTFRSVALCLWQWLDDVAAGL